MTTLDAVLEPGFQRLDFGLGPLLADGNTLFGWKAADFLLDFVEPVNADQGFRSDGRRRCFSIGCS